MSNSSLVTYTKISPHKTSPRNHEIDTITIHHAGGNISATNLAEWFNREESQASSNYGIDSNGTIAMFVEEKDRSWCSSDRNNDNRAITIEVANIGEGYDEYITEEAWNSLVNLCVDICKRNKIPKMLWKNDNSYVGDITQQNVTLHKWFTATECPGFYLIRNMDKLCAEVNTILNSENVIHDMTKDEAKQIVKTKAELSDQTIEYIAEYYKWGEPLIIKLAKAILKGDK